MLSISSSDLVYRITESFKISIGGVCPWPSAISRVGFMDMRPVQSHTAPWRGGLCTYLNFCRQRPKMIDYFCIRGPVFLFCLGSHDLGGQFQPPWNTSVEDQRQKELRGQPFKILYFKSGRTEIKKRELLAQGHRRMDKRMVTTGWGRGKWGGVQLV